MCTYAFVAVACFQRNPFLTQAHSMRTQQMTIVAASIFSSPLGLSLGMLLAAQAHGQVPATPPFIDMHVHSTNTTPEVVRGRMDRGNLRVIFLSALTSDLPAWTAGI